jgi:hypothetical protein
LNRLEHSNKQLERERNDLQSKLNLALFASGEKMAPRNANETSATSIVTQVMFDTLLKEKHEVEARYHELFASYTDLLDHNRNLTRKLEFSELANVVSVELSKESKRPDESKKSDLISPQRSPDKGLRKSPNKKLSEVAPGKIIKNKENNKKGLVSPDGTMIRSQLRTSEIYGPRTIESSIKKRPQASKMDVQDLDVFSLNCIKNRVLPILKKALRELTE